MDENRDKAERVIEEVEKAVVGKREILTKIMTAISTSRSENPNALRRRISLSEETVFAVSHAEMGLHTCPGNYSLFHVLGGYPLKMDQEVTIAPKGVLFIRYLSRD